MNEVKKGLDAVSGITPKDMEDVKQRVLLGKRKQKKRNPFPAVLTVLVTAAVLFFAFNVLMDGLNTADEEEYEVNELVYDFMLRIESDGNGAASTDEIRQEVLRSILQIDALMDYAKTSGYSEDMEVINETVAEQRDTFYEDLDKEGEERKNSILQAQTDAFGITYDEYFNVLLKWTARAEAASNWLDRHPQEESVTRGEALGLFQNKYERAITDFMEQKSIPPFDLSVKSVELEGTVASIEGERVIITHGFVKDAPSKMEELMLNGAASQFIIDDAAEEIALGMKIRVVYDALAYPVATQGNPVVYQKVTEWEQNGFVSEIEYPAKNEGQLSDADIETAYDMCVSALTGYYHAVWNGSSIDLDMFMENENLKQYTKKKIQSQHDLYGGLNSPVKNVEIGAWEVTHTEDVNGGFLYLELPAEIKKYQGGYSEATEFLVRNVNGKLVIVDWYTGAKDSYDFMVRGEDETINDPDIWNDQEWVKKLDALTD